MFVKIINNNKFELLKKNQLMEAREDIFNEDNENEGKKPKKKNSSREIVIPVIEDDVDLETVRDYISKHKKEEKEEDVSSNMARNGSIMADFDVEAIGERKTGEIIPIHLYEVKEKIFEEFKRRMELSEAKYKQCQALIEGIELGKDPEKALLFATEASSLLYEQFIATCSKLGEDKHKAMRDQKVKCMLLIAKLHYEHKNYQETIRELSGVIIILIINQIIQDFNDAEHQAYYLRAKAMKKLGKFKSAMEDMKKTMLLAPDNTKISAKFEVSRKCYIYELEISKSSPPEVYQYD